MTPPLRDYMLANQPVSAKEAAQALGITRQSICAQIRGETHITAWTRSDRGHAVALYVLGRGRNAVKPQAMSQAERSKAYAERHSARIKARRPSATVVRLGVWAGLL